MVLRVRVLASVAVALAGLFAVGVAAGQTPEGDAAEPAAVIGHSAGISEANALIAWVDVRLGGPARALVEYWNEDARRFRTRLSDAAVEHRIPVVRLRAETAYRYEIGVEAADGAVVFERGNGGEFTTGELPENLAAIEWAASGRSTLPLILGDFRLYLLFWDELGRIVWYHAGPPDSQRVGSVRLRTDGNLVYGSWPCCLREITPLGETVGEYRFPLEGVRPHHDFLLLEDGRVLTIGRRELTVDDSASGGEADRPVQIDALYMWDLAERHAELVWDAAELWEAHGIISYTHSNSVQTGPVGELIVSMRRRDQVVAISPDFGTVEWLLGGPGSDYAFPEAEDRFYAQHTATVLPNGNVLLFDNGSGRPGTSPWPEDDEAEAEWSRALELRLDEASMTATKAWEFRPEPDVYGSALGSTQRLANGNTLINFGTGGLIVEVDADGDEVFRLTAPNDEEKRQYRAYGDIASIMGETRVPTAAELRAGLGGAELNRRTTWRGGMATTASNLLGALVGGGARTLHLYDGTVWRSWAAPIEGEPVPGAQDFLVVPGAVLWIGG